MSLYGLHEWDPKTWTPEKGCRLLTEAHREAMLPFAIIGIIGGIGGIIIVIIKLCN